MRILTLIHYAILNYFVSAFCYQGEVTYLCNDASSDIFSKYNIMFKLTLFTPLVSIWPHYVQSIVLINIIYKYSFALFIIHVIAANLFQQK